MNAFVLASLVALAPAQQSADTLTLQFDWPPGVQLDGSTQVTARQSQAGQQLPEQTAEIDFTLSFAEHPQGRLVSTVIEVPGAPPGATPPPEPAYIVGTNGDFIGVSEVDQIVQQLREQTLAQAGAQTGGEVPPEIREMVEGMITSTMIENTVRQEFMNLAGYWAGETLERNEVVFEEGVYSDPVTQSTFPAEMELVWRGYAPCAEGEGPESCVRLDVSIFPDRDELAIALEEFFGNQAGAPGMILVDGVDQSVDIQVIAEPGSLIPRRVTKSVESTISVTAEGETLDLAISQTEATTYSRAGGMQ